MINLPQLAERLQASGLINKSFMDCTKDEILHVCKCVFSSVGDDVPQEGWQEPYIAKTGELVIPLDVHPKYRWWEPGGDCLRLILINLGADYNVARQYLKGPDGGALTEAQWYDMTIPF